MQKALDSGRNQGLWLFWWPGAESNQRHADESANPLFCLVILLMKEDSDVPERCTAGNPAHLRCPYYAVHFRRTAGRRRIHPPEVDA